MPRHVRSSKPPILSQAGRTDRIGGASMKAARESYNLLSLGRHPRHSHRVLVRFRSRVAEERFADRARRKLHQTLSRTRTHFRVNEVRVEEQRLGLRFDSRNHARVAMPCPGDGVPAIKVQITLAVGSNQPDALPALCRHRHFLVCLKLEAVFKRLDRIESCACFCFHPALAPSGTRLSGTASTG